MKMDRSAYGFLDLSNKLDGFGLEALRWDFAHRDRIVLVDGPDQGAYT